MKYRALEAFASRARAVAGISQSSDRIAQQRVLEGEIREAIKSGDFDWREVIESAHEVFCTLVPEGRQAMHRIINPEASSSDTWESAVLEATPVINSSMFPAFLEKAVEIGVFEAWEAEGEFLAGMIPTMRTTKYEGERKSLQAIQDVSNNEVDALIGPEVKENEPYPSVGASQYEIETPKTIKRGMSIAVNREALFFHTTGNLIDTATGIGQQMRWAKDNEIMLTVMGYINNNFKFGPTGGVATNNTYKASASGTFPYINEFASKDIDTGWPLIDEIVYEVGKNLDPVTGRPLMFPNVVDMIVSPAKVGLVQSILGTDATYILGADSASQRIEVTNRGRGVPITMRLHTSHRFYQLHRKFIETSSETESNDHFYLGDIAGAFAWVEAWPFQLERETSLGYGAFVRDIVQAWKVGYRGVAYAKNPVRMAHVYNANT